MNNRKEYVDIDKTDITLVKSEKTANSLIYILLVYKIVFKPIWWNIWLLVILIFYGKKQLLYFNIYRQKLHKLYMWVWRKGAGAKNFCYSCRGVRLCSQNTHQVVTIYNCSSRGSDPFFFCPPCLICTHGMHTYIHTYIHTSKTLIYLN